MLHEWALQTACVSKTSSALPCEEGPTRQCNDVEKAQVFYTSVITACESPCFSNDLCAGDLLDLDISDPTPAASAAPTPAPAAAQQAPAEGETHMHANAVLPAHVIW